MSIDDPAALEHFLELSSVASNAVLSIREISCDLTQAYDFMNDCNSKKYRGSQEIHAEADHQIRAGRLILDQASKRFDEVQELLSRLERVTSPASRLLLRPHFSHLSALMRKIQQWGKNITTAQTYTEAYQNSQELLSFLYKLKFGY